MIRIDSRDSVSRDLARVEAICFDFDGVFTDNFVYVNEQGIEAVRCWRSDGLGLSKLRKLGIKMAIFSTEKNPVVGARARKLELECFQGLDDKASAVTSYCAREGISLENAAFVGNDINDIPAFQVVGFPMAVADAYPDVQPYILYQTTKPGGRGAVREICDALVQARVAKEGDN